MNQGRKWRVSGAMQMLIYSEVILVLGAASIWNAIRPTLPGLWFVLYVRYTKLPVKSNHKHRS